MSAKTICDFHNKIVKLAKELQNLSWTDDVSEIRKYVEDNANDIQGWAEDALISGQKMEDRLKEYRDAIESLGFDRRIK